MRPAPHHGGCKGERSIPLFSTVRADARAECPNDRSGCKDAPGLARGEFHYKCTGGWDDGFRGGLESVFFACGDNLFTDDVGIGCVDKSDDATPPAAAGEAGAEGTGIARGFNDDVELAARIFEGGAGGFVRVEEELAKLFELVVG